MNLSQAMHLMDNGQTVVAQMWATRPLFKIQDGVLVHSTDGQKWNLTTLPIDLLMKFEYETLEGEE